MTDLSYAPFPEADLREMDIEFTQRAGTWQSAAGKDSEFAKINLQWATICQNAIASYDALQTRYLEDTTALKGEIGQLRAELLRRHAGAA